MAKASIVIYARIQNKEEGWSGWRRGSVIQSRNGKVKPGVMLYSGVEYPVTEPDFQLRTYKNGRAVYTTIPGDLEAAEAMLDKYLLSRQLEEAETSLGIRKTEEAPKDAPKPLKELVDEYLNKKASPSLGLSSTAVRHYRDALLGFLKVSKREYLSHVSENDVVEYMDAMTKDGYPTRLLTV